MYLYHRINLNIYSSNMEQAVNSFSEGIQLDTHPMVQGNNSLTDCLNGTLITMNGNEAVLQNDMGNRRVDNAFLPAGYEPVGMKEYGGIIYIAAYNPITNRSQIGSFPSPERKISKEDIKDGLGGTLGFNFSNDGTYLTSDTILIPLTDENTLHAGDKFVVYSNNFINNPQDYITNYDNVHGTKVNSPKNKKYTLSLGILNSQNEFVDITKTLCRWEGNTLIEFNNNESDIYKFNSGYFIAQAEPNVIPRSSTLSDKEFIEHRQVMPVNTYSYKLVGPLYLKAELNHIQDFNYNIYGVKSGDNIANLYIESFITYNCPDWVSGNPGGDDIYYTYELGNVTNNINGWFKLRTETNNSWNDGDIINNDIISYDVNTNTYFAKVVKKFTNVTADNNGLIHYTLGVLANSDSTLYLKNLSQEGVIDLSKLGSGDLDLLGWRFHNNNESTTLTYIFDAYPKYEHSFKNLTFSFTDVNKENDTSVDFEINNLSIYNGKNTINIDWEKYGIEPQKLYKVEITAQSIDNSGEVESSYSFVRWFLSTDLMNDCYAVNSPSFIADYGNPKGSSDTEGEKAILNDKLNLRLSINLNAINNSKVTLAKDLTSGQWIKKVQTIIENERINVEYEHKLDLNIEINPKVEIENKEFYPDIIKVNNNGTVSINNTTLDFNDEDIILKSKGSNYGNTLENFFIIPSSLTINNFKITGLIKFYDKFQSKASFSGTIKNPFGRIDEWLKPIMFPSNGKPSHYGGLGVDYHASGSDDGHVLNAFFTNTYQVVMSFSDASDPADQNPPVGRRISEYSRIDGERIFAHNEYQDLIYDYFDSKFENQMCFYIFESEDKLGMKKSSERNSNGPDKYLNSTARVWFKTVDGWAIFQSPMEKIIHTNGPWSFIKGNLFKYKDLIYCFSESIPCLEAKIATPDNNNYIYNNKYSLSKPLTIQCTISGTTISSGTSIQCKNGNNSLKEIVFTKENGSIQKDIEYNIKIESSENFQDKVNDMIENEQNLQNIYIDTGQSLDIDGLELNPNKFYYISNNKLIIDDLISNDIRINREITYTYGNYNVYGILWRGTQTYTPTLRYDVTGWDGKHHWTLFDYTGIKTI